MYIVLFYKPNTHGKAEFNRTDLVQFSSVSRRAFNRRRPATIRDDSATKLAVVAGYLQSGHTVIVDRSPCTHYDTVVNRPINH